MSEKNNDKNSSKLSEKNIKWIAFCVAIVLIISEIVSKVAFGRFIHSLFFDFDLPWWMYLL